VVDDRNGPEIGIGIQGNGEVEIYEPGEYSPFWLMYLDKSINLKESIYEQY